MARLSGSVSFETAEGLGTVFHVALPAARHEAPARESERELPRILHVDDDEDVLKVVESAFEGRARVEPAVSLAGAREKLVSGDFALMILDIGLADGSGLDLLRETRVPALIFTAQDSHAAASSLTNEVFIKSRATLDELIDAAERVMDEVKGS